MREYVRRSEKVSRTLDSNPKASRQKPVSDIFQACKSWRLGNRSLLQCKAIAGVLNIGNAIQEKIAQFWPPAGMRESIHFRDRAVERGVSDVEADNAVAHGNQYNDPDYPGGRVYHDPTTGTTVCTQGGTATTCYKQTYPKSRWR